MPGDLTASRRSAQRRRCNTAEELRVPVTALGGNCQTLLHQAFLVGAHKVGNHTPCLVGAGPRT